ncbi:MAG: SH3 domain-containing protein [Chloroflexota bacterium]
MNRAALPRHVPFYDLFKLIVAVVLTIIFIILLLRDRTEQPLPTGSLPTPTFAPTELASPIPTFTPAPAPLPTPSLGLLPTTQPFPTADASACPSSPSHIQVSDRVRVRSWLNFRTGPGLNWPIIHTNTAGTIMEVIGGPFCTTKDTAEGVRAYLWWNVRMENGEEGWSAEAPLIDPDYFLEQIP